MQALPLAQQAGNRIGLGCEHARLRLGDRGERQRADAHRERLDEGSDLDGGQGPVHEAPLCGGAGVEVGAAEGDLERTAATDQPWEALRPAAAGDDAEKHLGLAEHRVERGDADVHRRHELATAAADDALDDRDGRLRHRAEPIDERVEEAEGLVRLVERLAGERQDRLHIRVRDEEVAVGRLEHEHAHAVIVRDLAAEAVELEHERDVQQVHGWVVDDGAADAAADRHVQQCEVVVGHGRRR